ncbi:MAG: DHHA1 domain-containing protein [Gemmatimonadaceae bacterium]
MTNRIYYTDAYRAEFTASVVGVSADGLTVYVDETAFYPTSGGQPHDLGTLGGVQVVDVIDEDSRIGHVLAAKLGAAGTVNGVVDWTRRYDNMQQHTGQHLLSAVFEDLFGFKTVSVHFGDEYSTVDVETDSLSRAKLVAAEERANAIVGEARPVTITVEDAATAIGLRKASGRDGTLRVVNIEGVDRSACGGTHVRTTAELGPVMIRSVEKIRKATRVEFVCGTRALRRARNDFEALTHVATSLSASIEDAAPLVAASQERAKEAENAKRKLERDLAGFRARARYDAATPDASGFRTIVVRDAGSIGEIRDLAQASLALPKTVVVGALTTPPSVLFAASEDSGVDAGKVLKERLAAVGGRGGGSPRIAQGSVPDAAMIDSLIHRLVNRA